jgi:hypothetical protein
MRRVEGGDLRQTGEFLARKINRHIRQTNRRFPGRGQQRLLEAIGLALHTVDEYTPHLSVTYSPPFEDMTRSGSPSLLRIRRRENLIPSAAHRLQDLAAPQCCVVIYRPR